MENILPGLYIGIIGMSILFAALGLLSLVISLLDRIFRVKKEASKHTLHAAELPHQATGSLRDSSEELAAAVAAAVAVSYLHAKNQGSPDLGKTLEAPPGNWRSAHGVSKPVVKRQ